MTVIGGVYCFNFRFEVLTLLGHQADLHMLHLLDFCSSQSPSLLITVSYKAEYEKTF